MEASTLQAPAALARPRIAIGTPLLRLRSDDQLVDLFRTGHDEAFGVIHERYHKRLLAYARQMLPLRQDAEEALQDVFVRAYAGLRSNQDRLMLRPWLFRVAHNRCIDELRRPAPPPPEVIELLRSPVRDPIAMAEQREALRRLIADVRRLPTQQRSALLMRELGGMSYAEVATALSVSVAAVKSLLVRARVSLAEAAQARDTDCGEIREEIAAAHDHGNRPNATARKHLRDCSTCRSFRREVRGFSRRYAAVVPAVGPLAILAHLAHILGLSGGAGGGATAGGATAGGATVGGAGAAGVAGAAAGGASAVGGAAVGGGIATAGLTGHVAALIAAAVATAGGAVGLQHAIAPTSAPGHAHRAKPHHPTGAAQLGLTGGGSAAKPRASSATAASADALRTPMTAIASITAQHHGRAHAGSDGSIQGSAWSGRRHHLASGGVATGDGSGIDQLVASVPANSTTTLAGEGTSSTSGADSCATGSTSAGTTTTSSGGGTTSSSTTTSSDTTTSGATSSAPTTSSGSTTSGSGATTGSAGTSTSASTTTSSSGTSSGTTTSGSGSSTTGGCTSSTGSSPSTTTT